jgi:hypothetical protein
MPSKKIVYECKYCRKEFTDYDECEEHEHTHICAYDEVDNVRIAKELRLLGEIASGYHIGGMVMGMPLKNYENLMEEAANRLEKRE